jgi:hypothetical protein
MADNEEITQTQSQTILQQHSIKVDCQVIERSVQVSYLADGVYVICMKNHGGWCAESKEVCYIVRNHERGPAAEASAAAAKSQISSPPLNSIVPHPLAKAQLEQEFEKQLADARRLLEDLVLEAIKIPEGNEYATAQLDQLRRSRLEGYVNVVNAGCEKYLSGRFDQHAFEEKYKDAFIQLLDDEEISALVDSLNTKYRHFQFVIQKWRKISHDH